MRFLVDAQLPPALARWLAAQGHEAEHISDCGLSGAADVAIWNYAAGVDPVIVTKDADFAQKKALDRSGPTVVWIRLPNTRRRDLLVRFGMVLPRLLQALERGEMLIEII